VGLFSIYIFLHHTNRKKIQRERVPVGAEVDFVLFAMRVARTHLLVRAVLQIVCVVCVVSGVCLCVRMSAALCQSPEEFKDRNSIQTQRERHTHTQTRAHNDTQTHTHTHKHINKHPTRTCKEFKIKLYTDIDPHTHTHKRTHTHTQTYTHMHANTHTQTSVQRIQDMGWLRLVGSLKL